MSPRFRIALAWLLLFALPFQAFAAAAVINCGPNHHRMSVTVALTPAAAQPHVHEMGDHIHAHAGGAGIVSPDATNVEELGAPMLHHLDKLSKFKCSACAACCIGAALPTAVIAIASFAPAIVTATFVATLHVDFVADGLDPPPRLFLA